MDNLSFKVDWLIEVLVRNRDLHEEVYRKALAGYKAEAIRQLSRAIDEVDNGAVRQVIVTLPVPEEHTEDYDVVIDMLDHCQEETIELDQDEYRQYVLDKWGWRKSWLLNTTSYVSD